jgi:putative tricarboxylic transport membrane protein
MGALIPMISLGIPGSAADVILIAALTLQNVQLGPLMIVDHPEEFYGIISAAMIANFAMLIFMVLAARHLLFVLKMPKYILTPAILFFCMVGTLTYSNNPFELWIFFGFTAVGLIFLSAEIPLPAFIIGFVLTPIGEEAVRAAMMESRGSLMPFITRPVPLILLSVSLLAVLWAARQELKKRKLAK